MVQGNLLSLTVGHWLIASRTGVIADAVASVDGFVSRSRSPWMVSAALAVATGVVDYFVHPGQFGPRGMEAVVTGLAAGVLSYLVGALVRRFRRPPEHGSPAE